MGIKFFAVISPIEALELSVGSGGVIPLPGFSPAVPSPYAGVVVIGGIFGLFVGVVLVVAPPAVLEICMFKYHKQLSFECIHNTEKS